jgi:hypothetical protein
MVLGLSAGNVRKLKDGMPIIFDGSPFGWPADVLILYGETEADIAKQLLRETGVASSDQGAPP